MMSYMAQRNVLEGDKRIVINPHRRWPFATFPGRAHHDLQEDRRGVFAEDEDIAGCVQ
jgi:hypothetical protein